MTAFERALAMTLRFEGGFSDDPRDPGNWTGGQVGVGKLNGTMQGISAKAHPNLNIRLLTPADVEAIYFGEYWVRISGDKLPDPVNMVCFEAAVNNGPSRAAKWLQVAVGAKPDGIIGPITLGRVAHHDPYDLAVEVHAHRVQFMGSLDNWRIYGLGWSRRLVTVAALIARPDDRSSIANLAQLAPLTHAVERLP